MDTNGVSYLMDTELFVLALIKAMWDVPNGSHPFASTQKQFASRHGSISIITFFMQPQNCVYLQDVYKLGYGAFTTAASGFTTIKSPSNPRRSLTFPSIVRTIPMLYNTTSVCVSAELKIYNSWKLRHARSVGVAMLMCCTKCITLGIPLSPMEKRS